MDGNKATVAGMVVQLITDNQLSSGEEAEIRKIIEERQKKRGEGLSGRCLAGVIETDVMDRLALDDRMKDMCRSVHKRCFKESRVGKMDSFMLSEKLVNRFQKDVGEMYGLNEKEMIFFKGLLQAGLNKMAGDGLLNFVPDREIFHDFVSTGYKTSYIENPYSPEETDRIMEWAERHPADVRGLAVSLWFTGGISFQEIVNLTKKDCWGERKPWECLMQFEKGLFDTGIRPQIVRKALDQRPKDVKYVFVVPRRDGSGWKKLSENGLQMKLRYICRDTGIVYKGFRKDEAARLNMQDAP